ncbi:MAG: ROK family transcriptional regulator [Propionibacteriaceae bacterium]|nr:ROK family transcriptional regulator [Propionibacteriaceae bacterium]
MRISQRPADIRRHNLRATMTSLLVDGPSSRAALAEQLGLSRAALTGITGDLLGMGLIVEGEGLPSRGRPRTLLHPNAEEYFSLGIDARLDRIHVLALALDEREIKRWFRTLPTPVTPGAMAEIIGEVTATAIDEAGRRLLGVGLAMPQRHARQGVTQPAWGWEAVDFVPLAEAAVGAHAFDTVDIAEAACLANASATRSERLLHIQVGPGAGMALGDRQGLTPSLPRTWGQIGHIPVGEPALQCVCGRTGCLDTAIGFKAFERYAEPSGIVVDPGPTRLNRFAEAVGAAAEAGNAAAQAALDELRGHLVQAIAIASQMESPQELTLGGYPLFLGQRFLAGIGEGLAERRTGTTLVPSPWGDDASVVGAAQLGREVGLERLWAAS